MRLSQLDSLEIRNAIKENASAVTKQCEADIAACREALAAAGNFLHAANEQRQRAYTLLAQLNKAFAETAALLKEEKQRALETDEDNSWKLVHNLRAKRARIGERIAFVTTLKLPEAQIAVTRASAAVEEAKADWLEAGCSRDRVAIFALAIAARTADAGAQIDLESSASARIMKQVDRVRRQIVPEMEADIAKLEAQLLAARENAHATLYG